MAIVFLANETILLLVVNQVSGVFKAKGSTMQVTLFMQFKGESRCEKHTMPLREAIEAIAYWEPVAFAINGVNHKRLEKAVEHAKRLIDRQMGR